MVIDRLEHLEKYVSLNPLFGKFVEYLKATDVNAQPAGKVNLVGDDLVVIYTQTQPKGREEAKLETHNRFIDIHIPLSGVEEQGYTARENLPETEYNEADDISFYEGLADSYIPVRPGMFSIYFPQDAHAPAISPDGVRKIIVKIIV